MAMRDFGASVKPTRVKAAVAAGTTDIPSDGVDMLGFQGVQFEVSFGTITANAVTSVKLQHSDDDVDGNYADVAGSAITVADTESNKMTVTARWRPSKRWVRCYVDRGTQNAVLDGITAHQYGATYAAVTPGTTIAHNAFAVGTVTGTA